jgi:chemotaxis signal transduction protein
MAEDEMPTQADDQPEVGGAAAEPARPSPPPGGPGTLEELVAALDDEVAAAPAATLGGEPSPLRSAKSGERLVVFSLAGARYAAPVANVVEVGQPLPTTAVPNVPSWVLGVANLRGEVLSVVDLAAYLGLPATTSPGRMMIVRTGAEAVTSGLVVDSVTGMLAVPRADLGSPAAPIDERIAPYLAGVYDAGDGVVAVLDFDRLLAAPEFRQFEPA